MDITGIWKYKENFEYGTSIGEVKIVQVENKVYAEFVFCEKVENSYEIDVHEKASGEIIDGIAHLKSTEVRATQDGVEVDYMPNGFDIHLVSSDKLVGSSYDDENVCGVFTLEKL